MKSTALKADREYWNIETLDIVKALQPSYMSLLPIYTITLFALFVCWKIKKGTASVPSALLDVRLCSFLFYTKKII